MSFGGILATALAGGAGVIGKQAGDDIADQRKSEMMRQEADIREQAEKRLIEFRSNADRIANKNRLVDTRDFNASDETIAATGKVARAAAATARDVERERLTDDTLNQARRDQATGDAAAAEAAKRNAVISSGSDSTYIKALRTLSAASAGPDRTDYKGRELDNAIKQMGLDNAKRVQDLKAEFGKAPPERQQQIKDELSILTGKDADKFVPVPLKDADGAISGYQVFDTKSGKFVDAGAGKGGGAPAVGTEVGGYVFNGGDPNDKKNWTAKAAGKQAGRGMLSSVTPAPEPDYRLASDGSGRMVDVTTGRTLTPEQSAVLQKIELGEPTTPGERALLKN